MSVSPACLHLARSSWRRLQPSAEPKRESGVRLLRRPSTDQRFLSLVVLGTVTLSNVAGRDARIATAALGLLKSVGVAASALLLGGTRVDSAGGWRTR